jgi:hypothetical protein
MRTIISEECTVFIFKVEGKPSKNLGRSMLQEETVKRTPIFWDITLCSPVEVHWCFGGMYCLHLLEWRTAQQETSNEQAASRALWHFLSSRSDCPCNSRFSFLSDHWITQATKRSCPYIAYVHDLPHFLSRVLQLFVLLSYLWSHMSCLPLRRHSYHMSS